MTWELVGLKESWLQPGTLQPFQTEQDFDGVTQIIPFKISCGKHLPCVLDAKMAAPGAFAP